MPTSELEYFAGGRTTLPPSSDKRLPTPSGPIGSGDGIDPGRLTPSPILLVFQGLAAEVTARHGAHEHWRFIALRVFTSVLENAGYTAILLPLCYHRIASQRVQLAACTALSRAPCTLTGATSARLDRQSRCVGANAAWQGQGYRSRRSVVKRQFEERPFHPTMSPSAAATAITHTGFTFVVAKTPAPMTMMPA